jgi:hypothetical protein
MTALDSKLNLPCMPHLFLHLSTGVQSSRRREPRCQHRCAMMALLAAGYHSIDPEPYVRNISA